MKVVVTRTLAGGVGYLEADDRVTELCVVEPGTGPTRDELLNMVTGASGVLCQFCEQIDHEFLEAAGPNLRIVANYAVGFENMDIEEATRRGVWITNTPDAVTPSTADLAWALMLGVSRRIYECDREVRTGEFAARKGFDPCHLLGGDFENKTLLIVGAGRIGYATAMRSLGWQMKILYCARNKHEEFENAPFHAKRVSLAEGLMSADFVSVHTPLTPETKHLIGERELMLMKSTACIVSTARGPVIDENALVRALKCGTIAGAGLDVYEDEPRQAPGLVDLCNTLLTPHVGSASRDQRPLMARMAQQNIIEALHGKRPPNALNDIQ